MVFPTSLKAYRQCSNCILDTKDDPNIQFNENGICQYCLSYYKESDEFLKTGKEAEALLSSKIREIKENGKDNKHYYATNIYHDLYSSNKFYLQPEIQSCHTD